MPLTLRIVKGMSLTLLLAAGLFPRTAGRYEILLALAICMGAVIAGLWAVRKKNYLWAAGFVTGALLFSPFLLLTKIFLLIALAAVVIFGTLLAAFRPGFVARRVKHIPVAAGLLVLFSSPSAYSYSVLTHEAIIDSTWDTALKPLLVKRFPAATPEDLIAAHAYAYGGSIIQDLGYYPFGSTFYSDLTHYVRSGDFIRNLILESQNLDEYAFALGALAHFAADNNGHRIATNVSVPLLYPKLRAKFGNSVTYADDPFSHSKTEFGFDVFQAAKSRYASDAYKDFIGFQVAKPVLQRAFQATYGMKIEHVFLSLDLAIGSYRRAVGTILPALTKVAWQIKSQEIRKDAPGVTRKTFLYNLSRSSYEKNWGATYQRPGFRSKMLAGFFRIVPKKGPFRALAFKRLTPETEKLYMAGFNASIDRYRELLADVGRGHLDVPNDNFDVGEATKAGRYKLTDDTYAKLLHKLDDHYPELPQDLRADLLAFYQDLELPIATKTRPDDWVRLQEELTRLAAIHKDLAAGAAKVSTASSAAAPQ